MKKKNMTREKEKISRRTIRRNLKDIRSQVNKILKVKIDENAAEWKKSNEQPYLEINAPDFYTLGVLEGKFLEKQIIAFKRIIKGMAIVIRGYNYQDFIEIVSGYEDILPNSILKDRGKGTLIDEMQGMADSIPKITFDDILLQNCLTDVLYGILIPKGKVIPAEYEFGCTSFAAIGNIDEKPTVIGQNFDFSGIFKPTLSFVLHKVENYPKIFSLRMGATLSLPAAKNEFGLTTTVNVIKTSIPGPITIPSSIRTRIGLRSKTAKEMCDFNFSSSNPHSYNIMFSDKEQTIGCEIIPKKHIRHIIKDYLTFSNTFISPKYQKYLLSDYSKKRQEFAENAIKKLYCNGLTDIELFELLSDKPVICRQSLNPIESQTLAFITNNYFGLGNPADNKHGIIPI